MEDNSAPQRDKNGDMVFPEVDIDFATEMRQARRTHVFHFKDSDGFFHEVDYMKHDFPDMRTDLPKFTLQKYSLFQHEVPATDEWFRWRNSYDQYLDKFFAPIFKNRMLFGDTSSIDKFDLILPVEKFNAINQSINELGLEPHKDFIFYLIAKIEEVYVHDVEYYDRPEQKKQIKNFPKEIDKLHTILKRSEDTQFVNYKERPPTLQKVTFHYNIGNAIKIEDPLLISSITKGTIQDFSGGILKNWEKQLKGFANVHDENQMPNQFRHRVCKALHNFFKHVDAFHSKNVNIPEKELEAIARILDFASLQFHNRSGVKYDTRIDIYEIKQIIKNEIKRNELVYHPTHLTVGDIEPDLKLLTKYFEKDFLVAGMQRYDQYDLQTVANIVCRFEVAALAKELIHIYDCLKQRRFQIGHQFEAPLNKEIDQNEDYRSWQTLLKLINTPNSLKKATFLRVEEGSELNFSEELSLDLIREALFDYYQRNKFEFENDFYETEIKSFMPPGSFQLIPTGALSKPAKRFFPTITKQLYSYLLNELPPTKKEWKPSDRYYTIIAALLMPVFNLGDPIYDEEFIVEKVRQWHNVG